jgi:flagellar hook-associated protein 3 FlgL
MRVTQSMYYDSIYGNNNSKLNRELFDVNKQIASGLKIQYAKDGVRTFTETMRLDNEVVVLDQIKKSTESGFKVANQTDQVLNEFTDSMNRMRTLLVQAANGTNDETSLDAIADELRGIEKNLKGLANTSINGQFLFSGSKVDTRPISDDGIYHGDNKAMNAFVGSRNQQQYNLTGADLFLGEEKLRPRELTSNVVNSNLLDNSSSLTPSSTLRELMGDKDNDANTVNTPYFYLRGTQSDGTTFKKKIDTLNSNNTIEDLLDEIGKAYGNTGSLDVVNVRLGDSGEIIVEDKLKGSSKLDFHMVGAIDYSNGGAANKTDIDDLDSGETTYPPTGNLYVKEFVKSGLESASGAANNIEGLVYDRTKFEKSGTHLSSNVSQILKKTHLITENGMVIDTISPEKENAFAKPSTLLSEVADPKKEITPPTDPKTYTLDGTNFVLSGTDTGGNTFNVTINLKSSANGGSTFSPDGGATNYKIFNMDPNGRDAVDADKMTYQQLMDVMNMVTTATYPTTNSPDDYDIAIKKSQLKGNTSLSYDGKLQFHDLQSSGTNGTRAEIALYDANSDDFSKEASVMTFNTNNALTIRDPKTDFFKTIDEMITAVEDHKLYPDASSGHLRNVGIENALAKMDDLQDHVFRMHSKIGAQSNTLSTAQERTEILRISTMSLRSSVIDTDLAESSLRLQQLTTNYQAMLSTVGKVSQLSLVNYL